MQSHLPVKRWQRPLNATAELHGAVLSDPDLLHIILASVDRWTQSFPLHTMGVSRRVNKLWMTMGRSLAVRKAYCNIVNWMELPRYYCTHLPPPKCIVVGCCHEDKIATWNQFKTYCPRHFTVTRLPPPPPKVHEQGEGYVVWSFYEPEVMQMGSMYPHMVGVIECRMQFLDGSVSNNHTPLKAHCNLGRKSKMTNVKTVAARHCLRLKSCRCSARHMDIATDNAQRGRQLCCCINNGTCRWTPWSEFSQATEVRNLVLEEGEQADE